MAEKTGTDKTKDIIVYDVSFQDYESKKTHKRITGYKVAYLRQMSLYRDGVPTLVWVSSEAWLHKAPAKLGIFRPHWGEVQRFIDGKPVTVLEVADTGEWLGDLPF